MLGAEIADGILYGLIPVSFVMAVGFMAWIVRELGNIAVMLAKLQERIEHLEARLDWITERRKPPRRREGSTDA